jgi:hypothetical protein
MKYALNKLIGNVATIAPISGETLLAKYLVMTEKRPPKRNNIIYSELIICYKIRKKWQWGSGGSPPEMSACEKKLKRKVEEE